MGELNSRLLEVQAKLKAPKNQYNDFGKYKYRSCEDILEGVKPLLKEQGLTLVISDEILPINDSRIYVQARATISYGNESLSVTALAREPLAKKGMDDSQVTGTASSYARKYALNGLFLIDDTKDADTMDNRSETKYGGERTKPTSSETSSGISKEQAEELVNLCKQAGSNLKEIMQAYKVERLGQLTQQQYLKIRSSIGSLIRKA